MSIDSLTLSVLTDEIRAKILGAKINKIVQPERDEIVLHFYGNGGGRLVMSANPSVNRMHFTEHSKENPLVAPNFCMLLRKHLTGAVFTDVVQTPFERSVDFTFSGKNELGYAETKHLIFELTGKTANLILTDGGYVIFDTLKHLPLNTDAQRIILPGVKYEFFPSRDRIRPDDADGIKRILTDSTKDFDKILAENLLGVSTQTVAEMLFGTDKSVHSEINVSRALDGISTYLGKLKTPKPNIVFVGENPTDVFPFDYRSARGEKVFYASLNEAHDAFYYLKDRALRSSQKTRHLSSVVKSAVNRIEKKIGIQAQTLADCEKSEKYKRYGDLILANIGSVKPKSDSASVTDYFDENCPTVEIPLNKELSPQKNAQEYYKKYRKMKNTVAVTQALLEENRNQLSYVSGVAEFLKFSTTENDLAEIYDELVHAGIIKPKKSEKIKKQITVAPLKYSVDGFTVLAGKNNTQNDFLDKKAKPWDMWLHTQAIHSSHVIIETEQREIPDSVLVAAAEITAYYSPARGGGKTAVDYTLCKNLKKPPKSALGYVIYSTYNTLIVKPDEHLEFLTK